MGGGGRSFSVQADLGRKNFYDLVEISISPFSESHDTDLLHIVIHMYYFTHAWCV